VHAATHHTGAKIDKDGGEKHETQCSWENRAMSVNEATTDTRAPSMREAALVAFLAFLDRVIIIPTLR
jgi:hypothetical protein